MNIKGLIELKEKKFPIMEETYIFTELLEIPEKSLEKYGDNKEWAMSELYLKVIESVADKFPLIGEYLKVIHNNTEDVLKYITDIKFEDLSESDKKLFTDE